MYWPSGGSVSPRSSMSISCIIEGLFGLNARSPLSSEYDVFGASAWYTSRSRVDIHANQLPPSPPAAAASAHRLSAPSIPVAPCPAVFRSPVNVLLVTNTLLLVTDVTVADAADAS